jgi:hypothetical protein
MQTDGWAIRPDFLGRHVRGGRSNRTSKRVPARELARARGQGAADPGRRGFPSNSLRRIAIHTSLDHSASIGTTTRCGPRSAPKCGFSTSGCASLSSACRGRYKVFLDSRADAAGPGGAAPDCQPSLRRQLCGLVVRPGSTQCSAAPTVAWFGGNGGRALDRGCIACRRAPREREALAHIFSSRRQSHDRRKEACALAHGTPITAAPGTRVSSSVVP